jgi:predicted dehydrogenase
MKDRTRPHSTNSFPRREFIRRAAATGVATLTLPHIIRSSALGADGSVAASKRVTLGVIGTGNQGTNDLRAFLSDERVHVIAVCDVNRETDGYWNGAVAGRDPAKRIVEGHYAAKAPSGTYKGCDTYEDFRELLARRDLDAVLIATPDHWHAILVVEAAKARKPIYSQKPLSLTIAEGRAMSDAVKKHKVTFQCGSQQRSDRNFRHACELVRNGRIGKLHTIKVGQPSGHPDFGKNGQRKAPEPIPTGLHYDFWLGPAAWAAYAPARVGVNFRWNLDYSGGQVTDWGGHHPDIAQWGMGTDHTGPVEIKNAKGTFPPRTELWNTATEYSFECIYQNGVKMIVSDKHKMGVTFEGSEGSVYVTRGAFETNPPSLWDSQIGPSEIHLYESKNHYRNFIDCILAKKETIAPCEVAHRSITIAHLGDIAMLLGRDLKWDPAKERFVGDDAANRMLSRPYRAPWKLEV